MSDQKARDIIGELTARDVCGSSTLKRVGHRAWSRPRVAVSSRLYQQYRVPDPWDPESTQKETPVGLGPVSLRLGEKKRQPAPHLKPKPTQKEKEKARQAREKHRPPRLPDAPKTEPRPKTTPAAKSGSAKAAKQEAEAARAAEVAAKMRAAEAARGPRPMRQMSREEARANHERPAVPIPTRPDFEVKSNGAAEPAGETETEDITVASRHSSKKSQGGRFRMPRASTTRSPIVRSETVREVEQARKAEVETPAAPPPRKRTMPSIGGGGMDDLFGAAAQMGRVSLRSRDTEDSEDPSDDASGDE